MIAILDTGAGYRTVYEYAGGMKYARCTVKNKRQMKKAAAALRAADIDTVIPVGAELPPGFRLPEEDPGKLIHIAARQCSRKGQSTSIAAPRMSKTVERVCKAVLPHTRTLTLSCGPDTDSLAQYIHKYYGIAPLINGREQADLTIDLTGMSVNGRPLSGVSFTLRDEPPPPYGADIRLWRFALLESGMFEAESVGIP